VPETSGSQAAARSTVGIKGPLLPISPSRSKIQLVKAFLMLLLHRRAKSWQVLTDLARKQASSTSRMENGQATSFPASTAALSQSRIFLSIKGQRCGSA